MRRALSRGHSGAECNRRRTHSRWGPLPPTTSVTTTSGRYLSSVPIAATTAGARSRVVVAVSSNSSANVSVPSPRQTDRIVHDRSTRATSLRSTHHSAISSSPVLRPSWPPGGVGARRALALDPAHRAQRHPDPRRDRARAARYGSAHVLDVTFAPEYSRPGFITFEEGSALGSRRG